MSFWNPSSGYEDIEGDIQKQINGLGQYKVNPLSTGELDARTNNVFGNLSQQGNANLYQQLAKILGNASNSAYGQSSSMNLSNPFALQNRAKAQAFDTFSPNFSNFNLGIAEQQGKSLMQNPLTAFNTQMQSNQSQLDALMQLFGMQTQAHMGRAQSQFGLHDILPGLLSAGGQIGAAYINKPTSPTGK